MADITGSVVVDESFGLQGGERRAVGKFDFAAALVTADTYTIADLFPRNKTLRLKSFKLWGTPMDTNATPALEVSAGNSDDPDGFLTATVVPSGTQTVLLGQGALVGETFKNTDLTMTVSVDPATAAATGTWFFEVVAEESRI